MVVFSQNGIIRAKVVLFDWLYYIKWLYLVKSGCIRAKLVVFLQSGSTPVKWLYSGKSCCLWAKVDVFVQKWLYSDKSGCVRAKWLNSGKSSCIRAKWLYSGKVVVFG